MNAPATLRGRRRSTKRARSLHLLRWEGVTFPDLTPHEDLEAGARQDSFLWGLVRAFLSDSSDEAFARLGGPGVDVSTTRSWLQFTEGISNGAGAMRAKADLFDAAVARLMATIERIDVEGAASRDAFAEAARLQLQGAPVEGEEPR